LVFFAFIGGGVGVFFFVTPLFCCGYSGLWPTVGCLVCFARWVFLGLVASSCCGKVLPLFGCVWSLCLF
jgi:hypothetical protein